MPKLKHVIKKAGKAIADGGKVKHIIQDVRDIARDAMNSTSVKDALKDERAAAPGLLNAAASDFKTLNDTLSTFSKNDLEASTKALNEKIAKLRADYQDLPEVTAKLDAMSTEVNALKNNFNAKLAAAETNSKNSSTNHHTVMTIHDKQSGETNTQDKETGRTAFANLQANADALKTAAGTVEADVKTCRAALAAVEQQLKELAEKAPILKTIKQIRTDLDAQFKKLVKAHADFDEEFAALRTAKAGDDKAVNELRHLNCVSNVQGAKLAFEAVATIFSEAAPQDLKALAEFKSKLEVTKQETERHFDAFQAALKEWRQFVATSAPSNNELQTEEEMLAAQALEVMKKLAALRDAKSRAGESAAAGAPTALSGTGASFTPQATAQATANAHGLPIPSAAEAKRSAKP